MNWETIVAVCEIVGAIAVIVSLVYLATQIRQNTATMKMNAEQDVSEPCRHVEQLLAQIRTI